VFSRAVSYGHAFTQRPEGVSLSLVQHEVEITVKQSCIIENILLSIYKDQPVDSG
jgi:hypothetical protein